MPDVLIVGAVIMSVVVVSVVILGVIVGMGMIVMTVMRGHMHAMEGLVVRSMTATSTAMEEAVVRVVQGTSEAVGRSVSEGVVTALDGVVRTAAWGPTPEPEMNDDVPPIEGSGDMGSVEDMVAPWLQHLTEDDMSELGIDPTDVTFAGVPSMAGEDRGVVVPPGHTLQDAIGGIGGMGPMQPDMSGERFRDG